MFSLSVDMTGKRHLSHRLRKQGKKGGLGKILKGKRDTEYRKLGWLVPFC